MERVREGSRYVAYITVNNDANIITASRAFLERFSLSVEQMQGKAVYELLESEDLKMLWEEHQAKRKDANGSVQSENRVPIEGKRKAVFWFLVEIVTEEGETSLYFHDRTESYQAQMILESSLMLQSDVFVFFDTRECVLQCSEQAVRIFGFSNRLETLGVHCSTFFHNRLPQGVFHDMFTALEEGARYEQEIVLSYKGAEKYYSMRAFNVKMKNRKAGIAVCLKERTKTEYYLVQKEIAMLRSGESPYLLPTMEERFERFKEMDQAKLEQKLHLALQGYEYNEAMCMIEYLLRFGEEEGRERYQKAKGNLEAFCYEQAEECLQEES